jgi:hypothetical protein
MLRGAVTHQLITRICLLITWIKSELELVVHCPALAVRFLTRETRSQLSSVTKFTNEVFPESYKDTPIYKLKGPPTFQSSSS